MTVLIEFPKSIYFKSRDVHADFKETITPMGKGNPNKVITGVYLYRDEERLTRVGKVSGLPIKHALVGKSVGLTLAEINEMIRKEQIEAK